MAKKNDSRRSRAQVAPGASRNPKDIAAQTRVPLHLLPPVGAIYGAMACREGGIKYGPYNWREKPISLTEYTAAMERHLKAYRDGEDIDPKSQIHHLGKIIATASIMLDAMHCGTLIDDRPEMGGATSELLDTFEKFIKEQEADGNEQRSGAESSTGPERGIVVEVRKRGHRD